MTEQVLTTIALGALGGLAAWLIGFALGRRP